MIRCLGILLMLSLLGPKVFADPLITEFMASNSKTLYDEDGEASDWIEIYNPDSTAVNLDGWYLTDTASALTKWRIPAVTVAPKGFLIVFASSKNRIDPTKPLHTNFGLSAGGEYLGLVRPNGTTIVSQFAPTFPAQQTDISYGVTQPVDTVTFLAQGSAAKGLIPTAAFDSAHGTSWRLPGFDDSDWISGTLGLGYTFPGLIGLDVTAMKDVNGSAYLRSHFNVPAPGNLLDLSLSMLHDDGFVAFINGTSVASRLAPATLSWDSLATDNQPNPLTPAVIDLSANIPQLVTGDNLMAIHGLNRALSSSDLLMLPTLTGHVVSATEAMQTGFFRSPTPGARNSGVSGLTLTENIAFTPTDGTFSNSRSLALSGANTAAGQKIRYVLVPPSSAGAAVVEPTASSTLYTGPIALTNSTIVCAAVFNADDSRKGLSAYSQHLAMQTSGAQRSDNFTSILPLFILDLHGFGDLSDDSVYRPAWFYTFSPPTGSPALAAVPTLATRAEMRIRGSSSASFPKKSYSLEIHDNQGASRKFALLGLPSDDDWAFIGSWYYDRTHMHNAFAYEISRRMGRYAPRTKFAEVFSNFNGGLLDYSDYAGIYALTERIQVGAQRVAVTELGPADVTAPAVTGGYILKIDRPGPDEYSFFTDHGLPSGGYDPIVVHEPELADLAPEQKTYIRDYVQSMENAMFADKATGWTTHTYLNYLDRPSWIDHHIINVVTKNLDGLRLSAYFHKDRGGKMMAGPAWDFDRSMGTPDGRDGGPTGWVGGGDATNYWTLDWWGILAQDPDFMQAWVDRWQSLRATTLSNSEMQTLADQFAAQIGSVAAARDAVKWTDNASRYTDYAGEVTYFKSWLTNRGDWIDGNFISQPAVTAPAATTRILTPVSGRTIYYTVDGSDPRLSGGGISPSAFAVTSAVRFDGAMTVRARSFSTAAVIFPSSAWSGLTSMDVLGTAGFAGWAAARLPGTTAAQQAATADPDADGRSNAIEYAMDLDPAANEAVPAGLLSSSIVQVGGQSYLEFSYRHRLDRSDVTLRVQSSPDLSPGSWTNVSDTSVSASGVLEIRRARIAMGSQSKLFVRLSTTTTP